MTLGSHLSCSKIIIKAKRGARVDQRQKEGEKKKILENNVLQASVSLIPQFSSGDGFQELFSKKGSFWKVIAAFSSVSWLQS